MVVQVLTAGELSESTPGFLNCVSRQWSLTELYSFVMVQESGWACMLWSFTPKFFYHKSFIAAGAAILLCGGWGKKFFGVSIVQIRRLCISNKGPSCIAQSWWQYLGENLGVPKKGAFQITVKYVTAGGLSIRTPVCFIKPIWSY